MEESDNWKFTKISDPNVFVNLEIKSINSRNFHVILDDVHERVLFLAKMGPTERQSRAFNLLPEPEKKKFVSNLMILLFQIGIAASNSSGMLIKELVLQKLVYFDALTKDKFYDSLSTIWRGIETIQSYYDGLPGVPSNDDSLK